MVTVEPARGGRDSCTCLMILGNSEPTIRRCMDSALRSRCFDEFVIVLDRRITDATADILEGYRASNPQIRILWHDWKALDYSRARNVGLVDATMDRCFWLDGDEEILDEAGIFSLLQDPEPMAYHIWQVSPTPSRDLVWTHQLRLFPRLTGVKWELPIHEQVVFSLRRLGVPEKLTNYKIWHLGYIDEGINTSKHAERARVMEDWLRKHPRKDEARKYILDQYMSSMRYLRNLGHVANRAPVRNWRS